VKIDKVQQKIKIVRPNRQSNLRGGSCQLIFSLSLDKWGEKTIHFPAANQKNCFRPHPLIELVPERFRRVCVLPDSTLLLQLAALVGACESE